MSVPFRDDRRSTAETVAYSVLFRLPPGGFEDTLPGIQGKISMSESVSILSVRFMRG